jgi:hypothetical protein
VVALKLAEDPDAILIVAGTPSAAFVLLAATAIPPSGTLPDRVTVQELVSLDPNDSGLQTSEEIVTAGATTVTVPPEAVTASELPSAVAPRLPVTLILVARAVGASVTVASATTPGAIVLAFMPESRQV